MTTNNQGESKNFFRYELLSQRAVFSLDTEQATKKAADVIKAAQEDRTQKVSLIAAQVTNMNTVVTEQENLAEDIKENLHSTSEVLQYIQSKFQNAADNLAKVLEGLPE